MTNKEAVERALAVLASDAALPTEPGVSQFVAHFTITGRPYNTTGQITRIIPEEVSSRAWRARLRIQARFNREMRAIVPVDCSICGASFTRERIDQVRCRTCLEAARPRTGAHNSGGEVQHEG